MSRLLTTTMIALAALAAQSIPAAAGPGAERPAPPAAPPTPETVFSSDRVIVEWDSEASHADRVDARGEAEVNYESNLGNRDFQLVEVEDGQSTRDAIQQLRADSSVAVAERDSYSAPNAIPNDPMFGQLWGLRNTGLGIGGFADAVAGDDIDANGAWIRTVGTPTTVIADIDSGYRFEHPDLANVAWTNPGEVAENGLDDDGDGIVDDVHGADFVGNNAESRTIDGNPTDEDLLSGGHGVHTAGTMGAQGNNGLGITGVAQNVRIMPLRVCSRFPLLEASRCPASSQVDAINYAGIKGARVANMSLGGTTSTATVRDAIAANPQTLFVISAGNDAQDNESVPHYPCNYNPLAEGKSAVDNVICVAATNQADGLASFSDWGATSVDLGAPGTETLSTFPIRRFIDESFEANDFNSKWAATGPDGGFARTNESPLTSFGMSDSPGAAPTTNSTHETTSTAVSVPAGFSPCTLYQTRTVSLGGGTYSYEVLLNGSSVGGSSPSSSGRFSFSLGSALAAGGNVQLRFRYTAGISPSAANGVWLDDIELQCAEPVGQASGYTFLQGTSMAAPHVTGAAGLLFSLKPSATVTEVKNALLSSVDPDPALAGKTTTGGRLDVSKAIDVFDVQAPAAPVLSSTSPASPAKDDTPKAIGSAEEGSKVKIYRSDSCSGSVVSTGSAAELGASGIAVSVPRSSTTQLSATATDTAHNTSVCSAPIAYTENTPFETEIVKGPPDEAEEKAQRKREEEAGSPAPPTQPQPPPPACTVPKLAGKTLGQAKSALTAAHCTLGRATKPKAKRRRKHVALVVKSSFPSVGAQPSSGTVDLTLGPKPRPRKHHH